MPMPELLDAVRVYAYGAIAGAAFIGENDSQRLNAITSLILSYERRVHYHVK